MTNLGDFPVTRPDAIPSRCFIMEALATLSVVRQNSCHFIDGIPRGLCYQPEQFGLVSLKNFDVGSGGAAPQFDAICPYRAENHFVDEGLVSQR